MAFARHNIEKRRLIELVRLNPILWDCRLPHYKRSDKLKTIKWNELGKTFNVSGERVQRTFTSLREIFRRELNHEKLVGTQYKSKWEYYEAMAFLREVIRERKPRERSKASAASDGGQPEQQPTQEQQDQQGPIDEYLYFAPNDPNNPIIQRMQQQQQKQENGLEQQQQQHQVQDNKTELHQYPPHVNVNDLPVMSQPPQSLRPDLLMNINTNILSDFLAKYNTTEVGSNAIAATMLSGTPPNYQQQQLQQEPPTTVPPTIALKTTQTPSPKAASHRTDTVHALSSTVSDTNSPLIYIKEEPFDSQDESMSIPTTLHSELNVLSPKGGVAPKARRALSAIEEQRRQLAEDELVARSLSAHPLVIDERKPDANETMDNDTTDANAIRRPPPYAMQIIRDEDVDVHVDDDDGDVDDDDDDDVEECVGEEDDDGVGNNGLRRHDDDDDDLDDIDDVDLEMGCMGPEIDLTATHDSRLSCTSTATIVRGREEDQQQVPFSHREHHQARSRPNVVDRGNANVAASSAKEILYIKFGDFLAARLNSLAEPLANDLMNKILMLIAEK